MQKFFTTRSIIFISSFVAVSGIASAALDGASAIAGVTSFSKIVNEINTSLVRSLAALFLSLGLLAFFYGIFMFIWASREGNETKITEGKRFMGWGLVALFVMFSVYGIIKLTQSILFNKEDVTTISIPEVKFDTGSGSGSGSGPSSGPVANECANKANGAVCAAGQGSCQNGSCMAP